MTIPKITKLLKYRRPAWSATEGEFIRKYIDTIPGVYADKYGNRLKVEEGSKTIISVHTDTVHWSPGMQQVEVVGDVVGLHPSETERTNANKTGAKPRNTHHMPHTPARNKGKQKQEQEQDLLQGLLQDRVKPYGSNCLGADDTAGIYAALRMIDAGVKATFIFHRAEEIGGRGSEWLASKYPKWLESFDRCVALDRRGTADVITSQWSSRCCSDVFGLALAEQLGMGHKLAAGVFTDSANYTHLIPECSNLSIGYAHEHSSKETLDLNYLEHLIDRLVKVDWEGLPAIGNWEVEENKGETGKTGSTSGIYTGKTGGSGKLSELDELARLWALEEKLEKQVGKSGVKFTLAELRENIRFEEDLIGFDSEFEFDIDEEGNN